MTRTLPLVLLVAAAFPGCGGGDDRADNGVMKDAGSSAAVKPAVEDQIASFKFVPEDIVVKAGGTVTWTNRDKAPHTAESKPDAAGAFNTGNLAQGESKKIRFAEPGKVQFFCSYHRFMVGTVDVRK